ncbi:MAG: DUF5719 family protein [Nocardioides sp.]|nr:DUF5719 family protein [Nocardioides sp.]
MSRLERPSPVAGRRSARSARRGPGPALVLAVVVPVVALAAALMVRPETSTVATRPATRTPLSVASLSCPGAQSPTTAVSVSSLADDMGAGAVSAGPARQPLDVRPGRVTPAGATGAATVLTGTGRLAPALLATRSVADPLAAVTCRPATSDQWFTGVGAGAEHRSVLELVNPDTGPGVADVTVYAPTGLLDTPALRGVAVAAGQSTRFDLSDVVPRRGELTVRVQTSRGRLGASVLDVTEELGGGAVTTDWLPPQDAPALENTLVGLTRGTGARRLAVGNASDDEVRVSVEVITPRTVFSPEGLDPFRVPPQSTVGVSLDDLLDEATRRGALGLRVTATGPVTIGLRQATPDLSVLAPVPAVTTSTGVVLPPGKARLQLAGVDAAGTVTVTASDADGTELARTQVELAPGTADSSALPRGTALVTVVPDGIAVRGSVVVLDPGATVLGLGPLARTSEVADVRPGLP